MNCRLKSVCIYLVSIITGLSIFSCQSDKEDFSTLFSELSPKETSITFNNSIIQSQKVNVIKNHYLQKGGGVAIGDINNDGLEDIYFTSSLEKDRLYLNKGNWKFEDISTSSGINQFGGSKGGVSMFDINQDGLLDIYVCRAGWEQHKNERSNLLFINKGNNVFEEKAKDYGLASEMFSIQAGAFDYDRDGDLDIYVSNYPKEFKVQSDRMLELMKTNPAEYSGQLFRNDGNQKFTDVTLEAGVQKYGYGLGLVLKDINQDGWIDIYVANDFQAHDFYFINNKNGTFTESLKKYFNHCSYFGMGTEVADINNDGFQDIFVLEMIAEGNLRQKTNMAPMNPARFDHMVSNGMHYQYMGNSLQYNNGNGHFSDVANYAGVTQTDWSWGTIMQDFDQDGDNDILVTNGTLQDLLDKDYINNSKKLAKENNNRLSFDQLQPILPATPLKNYAFKNEGDFSFENVSDDWGFNFLGFSNGLASGDLDNDGDLDIVVSNINAPASVYRNNSNSKNYVNLKFTGYPGNNEGFNTKAYLYQDDNLQMKELHPLTGFQSSGPATLHFGVSHQKIDSLIVVWPNNRSQKITEISAGKLMEIKFDSKATRPWSISSGPKLFKSSHLDLASEWKHEENLYNDFANEVLLPHKLSSLGPALAIADVDGNGLDDVYIGGSSGKAGRLQLQFENKKFKSSSVTEFKPHQNREDVEALFFDATGNGSLDLLVISGSNEKNLADEYYVDRLYINDGKGNFKYASSQLPALKNSGKALCSADYDNDGDLDLFIGSRLIPGKYPYSNSSFLLQNNNGKFTDVTKDLAADLENAGMVSDAKWFDFDNDGDMDLVAVGEWTGIQIFENNDGKLSQYQKSSELSNLTGWWFSLEVADLNNDGLDDLVLGNLGDNYKYEAKEGAPFEIYSDDLDQNGKNDIVLGYYDEENLYPVRGFQCSSEQMPVLKKEIGSYTEFGMSDIFKVYGTRLDNALHLTAKTFSSHILWNKGSGKFTPQKLPAKAQLAPIQDILIDDFNNDKLLDILCVGNWFVSEVETPRADSGTGVVLINKGNETFESIDFQKSGFFSNKDARKVGKMKIGKDNVLVVFSNNSEADIFTVME